MERPPAHPRLAVISSTLAVVSLVGGWTWAAALQGQGFDPVVESISALAATATPHRWVMESALVLTGLAHLMTAWALGRARFAGRIVLAAGGVATLLVAAFPLPSRSESSTLHTAVATTSFVLLALWPWFASVRGGPGVLEPRVARPATVVMAAAVASLGVGMPLGWTAFGLHERIVAGLTVLWPLVAALGTWWWAGHRVGPRCVR